MNKAEIQMYRQMEVNEKRRLANEHRFLERMERRDAMMARREARADQMIGELNSGKLYVYPVGGKYREGTRKELIAFLLRNKYA
jgi:hypothetical protein